MADDAGAISISVKGAPSFCAALDVLELSEEMLALIPEWYTDERKRFEESIGILHTTVMATMRLGK